MKPPAACGILCFACLLFACSTPFSISGGFIGASITVNFPDGIHKSVPVVPTPEIQSPTLLVPIGSPIADHDSVTVNDGKVISTVPIIEAPVTAPVLAVPK